MLGQSLLPTCSATRALGQPFSSSCCFFFLVAALFIYWLYWVSLLRGLFSSCSKRGLLSSCGAWASHRRGASCWGAWAPGARASVAAAHGLTSFGSWAWLLRGMWNLPGPGIKPLSHALAGGFLSTVPPGKASSAYFLAFGWDDPNFCSLGT